jgi:hypothetical protein
MSKLISGCKAHGDFLQMMFKRAGFGKRPSAFDLACFLGYILEGDAPTDGNAARYKRILARGNLVRRNRLGTPRH